jgi:hypothetical protein
MAALSEARYRRDIAANAFTQAHARADWNAARVLLRAWLGPSANPDDDALCLEQMAQYDLDDFMQKLLPPPG